MILPFKVFGLCKANVGYLHDTNPEDGACSLLATGEAGPQTLHKLPNNSAQAEALCAPVQVCIMLSCQECNAHPALGACSWLQAAC